jgi:hypothetical protein
VGAFARILAISVFLTGAAPARAQSVEASLDGLDAALAGLPAESGSAVERARRSSGRIRAAYLTIPHTQRPDYARTIAAEAAELRAARAAGNPASIATLTEAIAGDLLAKAEARPLGAAPGLRGQVLVRVRTVAGGADRGGLVVGASPVALAGRPDPMFRFAALSSPTARPLPPGRYEFVVRSGTEVVARERADVGTAGLGETRLDIQVAPAMSSR